MKYALILLIILNILVLYVNILNLLRTRFIIQTNRTKYPTNNFNNFKLRFTNMIYIKYLI